MQSIKIYFTVFGLFCILVVIGCQKESHITEGYFYGVLFDAKDVQSDLNQNQDNAQFFVRIELTAPNNGADIDEVEVLVGFNDKVYGAEDKSSSPRLFSLILNSEFINNLNASGRPEFEYSINKQDIADFLNLSLNELNGGDFFEFIFMVTLENGISFKHIEVAEIVCTQETPPTSGEWQFTLQDDLSDSWDGAMLEILFGNESRELSLETGQEEKTFLVSIPQDVDSLIVEYIPGVCCSEEHALRIVSSRDIIVFESDDLTPGRITDFEYCGF